MNNEFINSTETENQYPNLSEAQTPDELQRIYDLRMKAIRAEGHQRFLDYQRRLATSLLEEPVTNLQVAGAGITTLAITGLLFAASCPLSLLLTLPLLAIGANLIKKGGAL